jgi:hypothetical protein
VDFSLAKENELNTLKFMAKKTTTPGSVTKTAAKKPTAAKAKAAAGKTTKPKAAAKAIAPKVAFTQDDIALRAYYIAEKRRNFGLPGDEDQDWIEAERQLLAESKPVKKTVRPKTAKK